MSEMKTALDGIIDRLDTAEEKGSELEGTATEPIQNETYNEKSIQKIKSISDLRDNFKCTNNWSIQRE